MPSGPCGEGGGRPYGHSGGLVEHVAKGSVGCAGTRGALGRAGSGSVCCWRTSKIYIIYHIGDQPEFQTPSPFYIYWCGLSPLSCPAPSLPRVGGMNRFCCFNWNHWNCSFHSFWLWLIGLYNHIVNVLIIHFAGCGRYDFPAVLIDSHCVPAICTIPNIPINTTRFTVFNCWNMHKDFHQGSGSSGLALSVLKDQELIIELDTGGSDSLTRASALHSIVQFPQFITTRPCTRYNDWRPIQPPHAHAGCGFGNWGLALGTARPKGARCPAAT